MSDKVWTVAEILSTTADFLAKRDPSCPRLEAELLLSVVLDLPRVQLYINFERILKDPELDAYRALVRRRAAHEPVAYILGRREFYGLPLKVTRDTLIPRPETEHLVDEALRIVKGPGRRGAEAAAEAGEGGGAEGSGNGAGPDAGGPPARRPVKAADIGCGGGAIAVALAKSVPDLTVKAVDVSPQALEVARENARTHQVEDRIEFHCGHLLEPLAGERFDLICANLPYVPDADMLTLAPDVAGFEPRQALAGGPEGLDLVGPLIAAAPAALEPGGHLLAEIWPDSLAKATDLARRAGLTPLEPVQDLSRRNRVLVARA